ncbi:hypothetical protein SOPP22_00440 [Shewanella sp. OPT22]|nr:hypothetical protein SOPP22_00440 [Shewanella sp. OPT22]
MTEQMNEPKLRFGEFKAPLKTVPLDKLTTKVSDGIHSTPKYDDSGEFFFVNGNNLKNGSIQLDKKTKRVSSEEAKKHHKQIGEHTILMSINGTIGNIAFYQYEPIMLGKSASYINIDPRTADKFFISNYLQREATKYYFDTAVTGSTIKNLSLKAIKNTPISSPTLPEQQKIASFLSKVDEKIGLLSEKKAKLTEYKRGVMQQLFNGKWQASAAHGNNQDEQLTFIPPTLRFKADDGSEFPDWEEKRYSDIFTAFKSGQGITASNIKELGEYPVYGGNGLRGYTNQYTHDGFYFLIGRQGALCGNINRVTGKSYISEHAIACKVDSDLGTEFYAQRLEQINLNRFSESSAQPGLSVNKLLRFKMLAPCVSEQAKIASFLLRLDEKVSITNSELEKAKEWKRGLLQQMFV